MNLKVLAQNMMTHAIMLQPGSAAYRKDLAVLLLGMNKFTEAEGLLRSALQLSPRDPLILSHLGRALAQQGRAEEARASYRNALAIDQNCTEAQLGLEQLSNFAG